MNELISGRTNPAILARARDLIHDGAYTQARDEVWGEMTNPAINPDLIPLQEFARRLEAAPTLDAFIDNTMWRARALHEHPRGKYVADARDLVRDIADLIPPRTTPTSPRSAASCVT